MSVVLGRALSIGGSTAKRLEFTYTGQYNERQDDGVVELLSTGILTVSKKTVIDYFMVGGGASGNVGDYSNSDNTIGYGGGGGAGGYTNTVIAKILYPGVSYQVAIGSGGAAVSADSSTSRAKLGNAGGHTIAFGSKVEGGKVISELREAKNGGDGGSGGGGSIVGNSGGKSYTAGAGGSDGSDGETPEGSNYSFTGKGGTGQGLTTREFGESGGKLYAGGGAAGGGASYGTRSKDKGGAGGAGGGGAGGGWNNDGAGVNGEANTGGGGGGSAASLPTNSSNRVSGAGGSGIVCIRLHKEA